MTGWLKKKWAELADQFRRKKEDGPPMVESDDTNVVSGQLTNGLADVAESNNLLSNSSFDLDLDI